MDMIYLLNQYFKPKILAPATQQHFRYVVSLLENDVGVKKVNDLTFENIEKWRKVVCSRNVSATTWNNYLKHIRLLANFAVQQEFIPARLGLRSLRLRCYHERPKVVEATDLQRVFNYFKSADCSAKPSWFWAIVVKFLYLTGIRRRQLAEMRWNHINFARREITLPASTSKSGRSWTIPISTHAYEALLELKQRTLEVSPEEENLENRYVFDISLFNSRYKSKHGLTGESLTYFFRRLSDWTNVRISPHRLRHTFATQLATQGNYKELQLLLGHCSVHTTMRYIHPGTDQMRILVNSLPLND